MSARRYGADTLALVSDASLDEDGDTWLVPGLVPAALPSMIVGPPKSFKSWIAYYLALCVASGKPAFGRLTTQARVLVISREDGRRETGRRLLLLANHLGVDLKDLAHDGWLFVDTKEALHLDRRTDVECLRETLREQRIGMVVIDSLSRANTADENDRGSMAAVTNAWSDLCNEFSCAVVVLHHEVKGARGPVLQRVRGTGDLVALLRVAIGVTKQGGNSALIEVDGNLASMSAPFEVTFVDGEVQGTKYLAVEVLGAAGSAPKRVASSKVSKVPRGESLARLKERIRVALTNSTRPMSGRQLREELRGQPELHGEAVAQLLADPASGVVHVRADYPVRGGHHPLWIRELAVAAEMHIVGEEVAS